VRGLPSSPKPSVKFVLLRRLCLLHIRGKLSGCLVKVEANLFYRFGEVADSYRSASNFNPCLDAVGVWTVNGNDAEAGARCCTGMQTRTWCGGGAQRARICNCELHRIRFALDQCLSLADPVGICSLMRDSDNSNQVCNMNSLLIVLSAAMIPRWVPGWMNKRVLLPSGPVTNTKKLPVLGSARRLYQPMSSAEVYSLSQKKLSQRTAKMWSRLQATHSAVVRYSIHACL